MIRSFVLLSLMMSASVAAAQGVDDATSVPAAKPIKEKRSCRDSDDTTSRIAKRVCRTAKEWDEARVHGAKAGVRSVEADD